VRALFQCAIGLTAVLLAAPAGAQGNIDAGRTPGQIFADTCASCHRSPRELRRASAGFLRQHYTAGSEEASAMAGYLAGLPSGEPRGAQPKRPPSAIGEPGPDNAKQQPKQQAKQSEPKQSEPKQPPAAEQPKSTQAQAKGRRPAAAAATAEVHPAAAPPAAEEKPPVPAPAQLPPPPPALEPFEE
jgi:hypothetical protein